MSRLLLLLLSAALLVAGCQRAKPSANSTNSSVTSPSLAGESLESSTDSLKHDEVVDEASPSARNDLETPTASENRDEQANAEGADTNSTASSENEQTTVEVEQVANVPNLTAERLLLNLPSGPVVIELRMTIDGKPHTDVFDRLVDDVLKIADANGDGRATWTEVLDSPRFKYGQLGNLAINNANERQQVLQLYDIDNDNVFDRSEVPRFLTRNAGGSRPFSLTSSNEYRRENRYQSRVLRWLDTDQSGSLTSDEFSTAPARLRTRDANEDELLVAADFTETSNQGMAMISSRRRVSEPDTAFLLSTHVNWESLLFSLEEYYAFGDRIRADTFADDDLFRQVDENGDGIWQREEVPNLLAVRPQLVFEANFGKFTDQSPPPLSLVYLQPSFGDMETIATRYPRRVALRLPGANVEVFVNDMVASANIEETAAAQFGQLDQDKNGYLDRDEYPSENPPFQAPFEAIDSDGDDKIFLAEAKSLLEQRQGAVRSQIRARAADQEDALFTALDRDGDGRLNLRETQDSSRTLAALDTNGDGRLSPSEIPPSFVVGLVRGDPQQGNNLFVMPTTPIEPPSGVPPWFANMDANGDAVISSREFLGTADQFAAMDADSDGFLSAVEVAQ